jgi:hypothetical protein
VESQLSLTLFRNTEIGNNVNVAPTRIRARREPLQKVSIDPMILSATLQRLFIKKPIDLLEDPEVAIEKPLINAGAKSVVN